MSLVTIAQARALINTSLEDTDLQEVINRVEAEVTARIGEPQNDENTTTIVETLGGEGENLFVRNEIGSVVSIVEDDVAMTATDYRIWTGGVIERLPSGQNWGEVCVVTFKPADDHLRRAAAIIDILRIDLARTAMESENIAGEYSYQAPKNWDAERKRIIRRVAFPVLG